MTKEDRIMAEGLIKIATTTCSLDDKLDAILLALAHIIKNGEKLGNQ